MIFSFQKQKEPIHSVQVFGRKVSYGDKIKLGYIRLRVSRLCHVLDTNFLVF